MKGIANGPVVTPPASNETARNSFGMKNPRMMQPIYDPPSNFAMLT